MYTLPPKADCSLCSGAGSYVVRTCKYGTGEELEPINVPCSCTTDWKRAIRDAAANPPRPDCMHCGDTGTFYDAWYDVDADGVVQTDRPCPYCNEGVKKQVLRHAKHHLVHADPPEAA